MFNSDLLARLAARSDYRNKHSTIVLRGGAPVAQAFNYGGVHSEVRALKKLWPNRRRGVVLVNFRLNHSGQVGLSKPCSACLVAMIEAGVSKVYYTDNDGEFVMERI